MLSCVYYTYVLETTLSTSCTSLHNVAAASWPNAIDPFFRKELHVAQYIVPSWDSTSEKQACTAECWHSLQARPNMVELLLSHQAKVNALGSGDKTPLLLAAELPDTNNKPKILRSLLEHGANVAAASHSGDWRHIKTSLLALSRKCINCVHTLYAAMHSVL